MRSHCCRLELPDCRKKYFMVLKVANRGHHSMCSLGGCLQKSSTQQQQQIITSSTKNETQRRSHALTRESVSSAASFLESIAMCHSRAHSTLTVAHDSHIRTQLSLYTNSASESSSVAQQQWNDAHAL